MNQGLGGSKKPEAPKKKTLLGEGTGKSLGGDASAPPKTAAAGTPAAAMNYAFDDEDDEDDAPAKAAASGKKASAPAGFNPFSDQPVNVPLAGSSSGPAQGGALPPPPSGDGEVADADVVPGARRDLWLCPHCDTKNKPSRTECRACGKSPHDEVIVPWFKKPVFIAAIAGGVVAFIIIVVLALRPDVSWHRPGAGNVDNKVRLAGGGVDADLGDPRHFVGKGRLSVSGRIIASGELQWMKMVVLGLGKNVTNEETFNALKVEQKDEDWNVPDAPFVVLFLILGDNNKADLTKGSYLSVLGDYGVAEEIGTIVPGSKPANTPAYVVNVKRIEERR